MAGSVCLQSCPERESRRLVTSATGTVEGSVCCQSYPDRSSCDPDVALPNSLSVGGVRLDSQEQWKAVSVASLTLIVLPGCLALCWQGYASPTLPAETQVYWFQGDGGEMMSVTKEGESGGGTVRRMG